jgi:hypothetical protein
MLRSSRNRENRTLSVDGPICPYGAISPEFYRRAPSDRALMRAGRRRSPSRGISYEPAPRVPAEVVSAPVIAVTTVSRPVWSVFG